MRLKALLFTGLLLLLAACGAAEPETLAVTVIHAREVEVAVPVTQIVEVTRQVEVTRDVTVEVTRLVEVEVTREVERVVTATPTRPPKPTNTPEIVAEIGIPVRCGEIFEVTVLDPPIFQANTSDEVALGIFLIVRVQLYNLTGSPYMRLEDEHFQLEGMLDRKPVIYPVHWGAAFDLNYYTDSYVDNDIPPALPYVTLVPFDVNPNGTDWVFIFNPSCKVEIPLGS
jgi:hypothetical protein